MFPGCAIECADDEILIVDPRNAGSWECKKKADLPNNAIQICPGKFHTGYHYLNNFETRIFWFL